MFRPDTVRSVDLAPEWRVSQWFNARAPLRLADLRGSVVVAHAFQMLCPGCVEHGLPQARRIFEQFRDAPVRVVGLHCVFEHHAVMGPDALEAFLHEYRIPFPVGVDAHDGDRLPWTMRTYEMRGTPTTLVFDAVGQLRLHNFGRPSDLALGAVIGQLLAELGESQRALDNSADISADAGAACGPNGCGVHLDTE